MCDFDSYFTPRDYLTPSNGLSNWMPRMVCKKYRILLLYLLLSSLCVSGYPEIWSLNWEQEIRCIGNMSLWMWNDLEN